MAIRINIQNGRQVICPVRFTRAVGGPTVIDAPDPDDRGFAMGARPGTWGSSDCRGPMVGIAEGDTVRVKVLHEDIDAGAPLFVTSTDTGVVSVPGSGAVGADGVFQIRGVLDTRNRAVKVQARLGSTTGPVLGELEPHIFQLRQLRVRAHLVSINGIPTARTAASLVATFQGVNDIWRPAGIEFLYDQALAVVTPVNLSVPGQMTTNLRGTPPTFGEFSTIINSGAPPTNRPDPNRINVYFILAANEVNGLTFANDVARPNGFGVVIADSGIVSTVAHELCHYLDNSQHACENAASAHIKDDIWTLRSVMFHSNSFSGLVPAYRNDVTYGAGNRGALISVKDLPGDGVDGELARARRRSLNPF